jgi:hypothetical protein
MREIRNVHKIFCWNTSREKTTTWGTERRWADNTGIVFEKYGAIMWTEFNPLRVRFNGGLL